MILILKIIPSLADAYCAVHCRPPTFSVAAAITSWHGGHKIGRDKALGLGKRREVDCVSDGVAQHRLQELHWRHAAIGRQDHSCNTCENQCGRNDTLTSAAFLGNLGVAFLAVHTSNVCSGLWGSTTGSEACCAVAAGTDDVIARCKQVDAATKVGTAGSERHELVGQVHCRHSDDLQAHYRGSKTPARGVWFDVLLARFAWPQAPRLANISMRRLFGSQQRRWPRRPGPPCHGWRCSRSDWNHQWRAARRQLEPLDSLGGLTMPPGCSPCL